MRKMAKLCECGCGEEIKEGKRYANHHFSKVNPIKNDNWSEERIQKGRETRRLKKELREGKIELPFCACGCGERVSNITKKYIHGHWKRGRTKENDERIRNNAKGIGEGKLRFFQTEEGQKWLDEHRRGENNPYKRSENRWNKGLTKETHEGIRLGSIKTSGTKKAFFQTEEGREFKEKYYNGKSPWNKGIIGVIPGWSKGLTKETDERINKKSERLKERYKKGEIISWSKGLTKKDDERLAIISTKTSKARLEFFKTEEGKKWLDDNLRGEKHPMYGKHLSEETRKKIGDAERGDKNPNYGKPTWKKGLTKETSEGILKQSKALKKLWKDPEHIDKMIKAQNRKPNKLEIKIDNLLQQLFPNEYAYNGDFSLGITIGGRIPDFVNINGQKKVVECYGKWWHKNDDEGNKVFHYRLFGFDCLVIWDYELKDKDALISKIIEYHNC